MASFAIPLVLGSFAAFGAAFGGGVEGATGNVLEEVSDSEEVSKPDSESEDEEPKKTTPPPEPEIPTPPPEIPPEPVETTTPPEPQPEAKPEPVTGGAIGRPTWAPISQSSPISLSTPGATGSAGIFAKITGSYKKGPADFQSELKDIDDQVRVLKAREFITTQKILETEKEFKKDPATNAPTVNESENLRGRYITAYNAYLKNKTLYDYNSKLISRIVDEKKEDVDERTLKEQYKEELPERASDFDDSSKKNELFNWVKNNESKLSENLKVSNRKTKSGVAIDANSWWGLLNSKSTKTSDSDPRKLGEYLNARETAYGEYTKSQDEMNKYKDTFEELDNSLKELKSKLKDVQKQIKDLRDKRELILVDLSNYELPKGLFAEKAVPQKTTLPTGEERDQIIRSIKDVEQQIKEKQTEINDYISDNLNDKGTWMDGKEEGYNTKKTEMAKLKSSRDESILKLEGREPAKLQELAKEIAAVGSWKDMVRELKLTPEKEKKYLNPKLISLFSSFETVLNQSEDILEENIEKYYDIFAKGYKSHLQTSGYTTLIKALYQLNQDLQGNCQFSKGDEVYVVADEIQGLYSKGKITKLIFDDNGGEKVCTSARISVDETGRLGFENDWATRIDQVAKNPPEEVLVEIQQLNIVSGSKTDTKYVQYKREAIPKLVELSKKLDRIQTDLIAKTDKSKKDKTIDLKVLIDSAKTFFNDGKLPRNTYGLLNLYATQKEKFNELIKKLTWENTKGFLLRILTALSLALTFILSSAFAGVKLVGSAVGNFLTQIGTLIKNAGIVIYDSFKENGVFGSRLKAIGEYFIQCGKFLGRKSGEIAFAIDDLLPKIDDDGNLITESSKRWQRAYELSGRKIVSALNFTSETLQSVLPTTKYVVDDSGKLIMKDDNSEYETTDIDENDYKERRAELCRRIGRGLTTAYDSAGKVITDTGIVLGRGASAIYAAGIYLIGIPQIVIDKLKELLPSQQVDGSGEFNGTEINLEDKTEEFKEKINVLKIRITSGKATSSEILAGVLLSPVGSFGFYMGILADKLSEAIAYLSTSAGIKNVFLGIWLESGKSAKNIGDQIDIMQRSIRGQELTDEDRNTLNNVGIKSINDVNDKLWKNLTYAKDISEIADFAIKSDPIEDISQTLQATYFSTVSLLERLSDSMNILWNTTKIWFGNKLNSILEFSNFILDSLRNGIPVIVSITVSGAAGAAGFVLGLTGATILIATNSLGVVSYCFIKIISSAFYTLKTSGIVLAAIFNPVTQVGKYPIKWIIWIFKLGGNIMTLGFVRKYYKDLSYRLSNERSLEEVVPFVSAPAPQEEEEPVPPTGGNHRTRRHWVRSKPSRFTRHRIY